jgi:hypothetical protein
MTMSDDFVPKNPSEFFCKYCDYNTKYKRDYDKHLLTAKHIRMTNNDKYSFKCPEKFICHCGKEYKYRQGLFSHKKQCIKEEVNSTPLLQSFPNDILNTNVIMEIIKENKEFKCLLVEQYKDSQLKQQQLMDLQKENNTLMNKMVEITQTQIMLPNTINNTNSNNNTINNNQKFNLNFFLNETCKDAMSIQEFLENIRITFEDLLTIGNSGFVNGVSDILIKQLRDMEVNKRPIHCTDSKRDTIYLKENAAWNKDDKDKTKLKQIIEKIEYKNVVALRDWCNENPDARVNNTPNNLLKDKIYLQTLQGDDKTRDKIIKNVSKEVMVEKDN